MFLDEITGSNSTTDFDITNIDWNNVWNTMIKWCCKEGVKIIISLVIIFISFKLINLFIKKIKKRILKKSLDKTLSTVLLSIGSKAIKLIILICILAYLGIETSGFAALLTTLGLGIGLAVQGSLSNFAGGVLILLTRPFRIGDYIESNGLSGTVENIDLFYTQLVTPDNKVIHLPNGGLSNSSITNYSMKPTRRLDMIFSISYEDDFKKAETVIASCIKKSGLALDDPKVFINIINHNTSSIDIVARIWVKSENYWTLHFQLLEDVITQFNKAGITIPFPQMDVHQVKTTKK